MTNLTKSQKQMLRESYRRGIVRELYSRALITKEQYQRLLIGK